VIVTGVAHLDRYVWEHLCLGATSGQSGRKPRRRARHRLSLDRASGQARDDVPLQEHEKYQDRKH
jgi:hypothetical protein